MNSRFTAELPDIRGSLAPRGPGPRLGVAADNPNQPVTLSRKQRRAHTHIIGATGRGKSVLLESLFRQDLEDPDCGACLIDPHGSAYHSLVTWIATERPELAKRVILFDPADQSEAVLGFNPIGPLALEYPEAALAGMVTSCLKAWGQHSPDETPRITRWLENIFTVIISNRLTLVETEPLISAARQNAERLQLLAMLNIDLVRQDWEEYDLAGAPQRHSYIEGPHNRLRKFLRNLYLRNLFGVQSRQFDPRALIEEKKILLVNLAPNDRLDQFDMRLIGTLLIYWLFQAALRRDPQADPHPFYLYIDEFGQFVSDDIAYLLEQCRKFGLFLTLSHQQLAQLREENEYLYASVLTNCLNKVVFGGLMYEDADLLQRELFTGFEDWAAVKYQTESVKFRPIEESRLTFSSGSGQSTGYAAAFARGFSLSTSLGQSLSRALSRGESSGWSETDSRTLTHAASVARGLSESRTRTESATEGAGESEAASVSASKSKQQTHTDATNWQKSSGAGQTNSLSSADSLSATRDPHHALLTQSAGHTAGTQSADSSHETSGEGGGSSDSRGEAETESTGLTKGKTRMATDTVGGSAGKTETEIRTASTGEATGKAKSRQQSETTGLTETEAEQFVRTIAENLSLSTTFQAGASETTGVSLAPFTRAEEFTEVTEHRWTLPEIQHNFVALLKNLGVGEAVVRFGNEAPVKVRIDPPPALPYAPRRTARQVGEFRQAVFAAAPQCYLTPAEARAEISGRQQRVFQRELSGEWFSEPPLALPAPAKPDDDIFG